MQILERNSFNGIFKLIYAKLYDEHEARKKSKELLEVAKRAVEIAIEENEEKALEYISKTENK